MGSLKTDPIKRNFGKRGTVDCSVGEKETGKRSHYVDCTCVWYGQWAVRRQIYEDFRFLDETTADEPAMVIHGPTGLQVGGLLSEDMARSLVSALLAAPDFKKAKSKAGQQARQIYVDWKARQKEGE